MFARGDTEFPSSMKLINVALASIFELIVDFPSFLLQNFIECQFEENNLVGTLSQ
jgi:hypothetical protein